MSTMLNWSEIYCIQKFLPLLTRWQLHHLSERRDQPLARGYVSPAFIKKKRTPKGIVSYEIVWQDDDNCFEMLIPESQMNEYLSTMSCAKEEAIQSLWTTIEPLDLVATAYPDLVEKFESVQPKAKGKKKDKRNVDAPVEPKACRKRKKKVNCSLNDMSALQQVVDEMDGKMKKTNKVVPAKKKKPEKNVLTIDRFFVKKSTASPAMHSSPRIKTAMLNLSDFSFDTDTGEDNLSQIIGGIVSKQSAVHEIEGRRLRFDQMPVDRDANDTDRSAVESNNCLMSDDEMDEFDLIVSGARKNNPKSNEPNALAASSTPILVEKFLSKHHQRLSSRKVAAEEDGPIETSFFAKEHEINNDVDLFERSVDFRNMEDDEYDSTDRSSSECESENLESNQENAQCAAAEADYYDSFDEMLELGKRNALHPWKE